MAANSQPKITGFFTATARPSAAAFAAPEDVASLETSAAVAAAPLAAPASPVSDADIVKYFAGFFDADGSVDVKHRHGVCISLAQGEKKKEILEFARDYFGVGTVVFSKKTKVGNQDMFAYVVTGKDGVEVRKFDFFTCSYTHACHDHEKLTF